MMIAHTDLHKFFYISNISTYILNSIVIYKKLLRMSVHKNSKLIRKNLLI